MKLAAIAVPPWVQALKPFGKIIALVLVLVLAFLAARTVLGWREAALANAATVRTQGAKIEATDALVEDGAASAEARATEDAAIDAGRDQFNRAITEAATHDPATASRASRAVPQRVRDAYRERRLARERLNDPARER